MMDMGFTKSQCKAALKQNGNNFDKALDKLLTNGDAFIGIENSDDSADDEGPGDSLREREERELQQQIQASLRMEEENKQQEVQNEVIGGNRNASYFGDGEGAGGQIGQRRPGQGLSQNQS